jgi:hypothetical protein
MASATITATPLGAGIFKYDIRLNKYWNDQHRHLLVCLGTRGRLHASLTD